MLLPFIGVIVFTGVYPKPMLDRIEPSVKKLIEHVSEKTGYVEPQPVGESSADDGAADAERWSDPRSTGSRSARCWCCSAAAMVLLVVGALTPALAAAAVRAVHRRGRLAPR